MLFFFAAAAAAAATLLIGMVVQSHVVVVTVDNWHSGSRWQRRSQSRCQRLVWLSVIVSGDEFLKCQLDFQVHIIVVHQVVWVALLIIVLLESDRGGRL